MSASEWYAVGMAAAVAYAGVAGVAWRLLRPRCDVDAEFWWVGAFPLFAPLLAGFVAFDLVRYGEPGDAMSIPGAVIYWPVTLALFALFAAARAIFLPIRAVFRMAAGGSS